MINPVRNYIEFFILLETVLLDLCDSFIGNILQDIKIKAFSL